MNSDDLECFAKVAQYGSISRAAIELGSDQSTVSRQIARLETDAQARLFHRSGRGVVMTEAGHTLLEHARRVSETLDEARRAVQAHVKQGPARLVIAAQPTIAQQSFGPLGAALRSHFPRTSLRFAEGLGTHVLAWLAAGEVDVATFYLPERAAGLKTDVVMQEDLCLIAAPGQLALGAEFPVRRLAEVGLILPSTPHGVRLLAESLAERVGIRISIAMECDGSTTLTKRLVQAGHGCTLLPLAAVAEEVAQGRLLAARLVEPTVVRDVAIATSRNRPAVSEIWEITRLIRQEIERLVESGAWPGCRLV